MPEMTTGMVGDVLPPLTSPWSRHIGGHKRRNRHLALPPVLLPTSSGAPDHHPKSARSNHGSNNKRRRPVLSPHWSIRRNKGLSLAKKSWHSTVKSRSCTDPKCI